MTSWRGSEAPLTFYSSSVYIDQERIGINAGGAMTRKRTLHDLRSVAMKRMADWWARNFDAQYFCYLSGARGVNTDYPFPTTWTGRANNALIWIRTTSFMAATRRSRPIWIPATELPWA